MLKTISKSEFYKLRTLLQDYYEYLTQNPQTLLTRFFGLHKITYFRHDGHPDCKYLTVMNNVFKHYEVGDRYDLKGSKVGRGTGNLDDPNRNKKSALKDLDFLQKHQYLKLHRMEEKEDLSCILSRDAEFLAANNIMDYSVLLGEFEGKMEEAPVEERGVYVSFDGTKCFIVGIIDILTDYK